MRPEDFTAPTTRVCILIRTPASWQYSSSSSFIASASNDRELPVGMGETAPRARRSAINRVKKPLLFR